ncbi:unnamed protein product [Plasmodium vivax]|uniref:(malaria parasite P. vivax) hypothetical protein n=1 Tax=Plasmodium vivax TaxID=5855 RepID=A0A8S4HCG2_PLAVI|nr:unnamed protein product [Plasmodium vivax]
MSDNQCPSVGSSVDSTLFNVLAAGRDKSKKTLEEIKALQERNKTLMRNELREYRIVNQLFSEHMRSVPGLLSTLGDSSQLGGTPQEGAQSVGEEGEDPICVSNRHDHSPGVNNPVHHPSTHLEENTHTAENETTEEGAAAWAPPENEGGQISKPEEPPQKGDPYAGLPSRMNLLQLKQKIERQRLTLSDVKGYQTNAMLLSEVKKIRQLSFSGGVVVKSGEMGDHEGGGGMGENEGGGEMGDLERGNRTGDQDPHSKLPPREEATTWRTPNIEEQNGCTKGGGIIEQLLMSSDFRSSLSSKGAQGEPLGESFAVALSGASNKLSSPDRDVDEEADGVGKTKQFLYSTGSVGDVAPPSSGELGASEVSQRREASPCRSTSQCVGISRIDSQYFTGEPLGGGNSGESLPDGAHPQRGKGAKGSSNHSLVTNRHSKGNQTDRQPVEVTIRLSKVKVEERFKKKLQFYDHFCLSICVPTSYEGGSNRVGEEARRRSVSANDTTTCRVQPMGDELDLPILERTPMEGGGKECKCGRSGKCVNHTKGRNEGKTRGQDVSIKYETFFLKSNHVNGNFISFGEDVHYKVERQLLESVERVAILLCASEYEQPGRKKKKKKKKNSSKLYTLQRNSVTIVKSLNRPFVVPDWYEILAYGEVPFIPKVDVEAPLRELRLPLGGSSSHVAKRPLVMVHLQLAMLCQSDGGGNCHLLIKDNTSGGRSLTEPARREGVEPQEGGSRPDVMEHVTPPQRIIQSCESNCSYSTGGHNSQGGLTEKGETNQAGASPQTVEPHTTPNANDVLYIYLHRMVNLSKRRFDDISICVRFTREEKYDCRGFTLEEEKAFNFLVNSKRRLTEIREVILEVWRGHQRGDYKGETRRDCLGIVNIPLEDLIQKEQVICLEKQFEMTHQFYENVNFLFGVILVRGQKDRQERVQQFCEHYIESYSIEGRHSLSKGGARSDESLRSSVLSGFAPSGGEPPIGGNFAQSDSHPPGEARSSVSISEQYFIYDSESLHSREYYVYELQREVLQKDVRSGALIASVVERAAGGGQTSDDAVGDDEGGDDEGGDSEGGDDEGGDYQKIWEQRGDYQRMGEQIRSGQKTLPRRTKRRGEDPTAYLRVEFLKEELLLRGMKEETVHLMIKDMKKNATKNKDKYILKTHVEEYIEKIFTKWERLTNKLFIRNKKKMLLNDVCAYLDSLYIDDDRYMSKEEFFLFFQEVGIVFVDSTVFDELCLLFFDKERKEIYFSAFSSLIIKRGVEELKNTVYGYDILLRLFGSFHQNEVTIEWLENELVKINPQKRNYYSERIKRHFSSEALRNSSADQGTADQNLGRFLREEENVCSCTSLLFLHSIRFMLTKFNNNDFSNEDLFFLVKYLLQTQCNYSRTDVCVLVNVIKGIESVNLSFFLALYHMYVQRHSSGGEQGEVEGKRSLVGDGKEGSADERSGNSMVVSSPRGGAQAGGASCHEYGRGEEGGQVSLSMSKQSDQEEALLTGGPDKRSEITQGGFPIEEENTLRGKCQTDGQADGQADAQKDAPNYDGAKEPPTSITETPTNRSSVSGLKESRRKGPPAGHTTARRASNDAPSNVKRHKNMSITNTRPFCNATDERKDSSSRLRKDIMKGFKNVVIILHGKIMSGLLTVQHISECLFRYFGRRRRKDPNEQNDKVELLMLFDLLGLYTSYEIAQKVLNWYAREVALNRGRDNHHGMEATNGMEATTWGENPFEGRRHGNPPLLQDFTAINHEHNIKKIIERYCLNEGVGGNIFSGSTLEDFFSLLKEKDIGIDAFSKRNIFTYSDFYATVEKLHLDFSRNYVRLLFSNLLTYDLTSFTSVNSKLIFFDCMEAYWLSWNRAHFEFHGGGKRAEAYAGKSAEAHAGKSADAHAGRSAGTLLDSVKQRRKELAIFKKANQEGNPNRGRDTPHKSRLLLVREEWVTSVEKSFPVRDPTSGETHTLTNLPLYSLFFYLSENGTLRGEELIKQFFFMNMFRCEMNSVNVDDYASESYTFYDFWQMCKDKWVTQGDCGEDDSFREDLLRLIVLVNGDHHGGEAAIRKGHTERMHPTGGPNIAKSTSSMQTLLKGKTHLFSKNFKKNLGILRLAVENLGKGIANVSHSPLGPCLGRSRSAVSQSAISFNANWNRSGSYDASLGRRTGSTHTGEAPLEEFLKRNKHVVGYIREFFYLFVFCCKVANNESVDLSFHEQEWVFYRGKLKAHYSQGGENKHTNAPADGAKRRQKDRCSHSPFLYKEVRICCEEKKFTSQEYKGAVYPYLLLLSDLLKRIVHIYKEGHAAYMSKRFVLNYEEKNARITFLHRVENIMTRSGSFDSKEWNKLYSIFEALNIRVSEFLLNLWSCLEMNNYIVKLPNGVTLFNDCYNTMWDLMRPKGSSRSSLWGDFPSGRKRNSPGKSSTPQGRNKTDHLSDEWKELYVKNVKYGMAFNKLVLSDVRGVNLRSLLHSKYITQDETFTTHMTNLYVRALFNECILTGLNINRLFAHIDKKDSFIYVLSKNFNHIFSEEDIALFVKKYSFVVDMTSLHLRDSCHNFFSTKNFLHDLYRQGEYYNAELRGKLFRFFFKNEKVFFCKHHQCIMHTNFEPMDKHHFFISCDKLKNILSLHGLFLSWAELYDFFQPLNKFCVIYDSRKFELHEVGKPGPYILKAYINLPNLLRLAGEAAARGGAAHGGGEDCTPQDNRKREDVERSASKNCFHKKDSYAEEMPEGELHSGISPLRKEPLGKGATPRGEEIAKEEEQKKSLPLDSEAVYKGVAKTKEPPRTYFYHFRFNNLTMGRILFFFFIKLANLKSKSDLTHGQMYYGIKRAGKKDIVKKELKNACHLLLNLEEKKLNSIIPDDFVLKKEAFRNGVHLNLFLLRDRLDILFGEDNSSPIHVHQFVHFFDAEKDAVSFSNYKFVYNFSYEWVNRMRMKDEYVSRECCEALLAEFRLPDVADDSDGEEEEPTANVTELRDASEEESDVKKKKENFQNGVEDEKLVWCTSPVRNATPPAALKDIREDPPGRDPLWKDELVKRFGRNIKGKWKKILMPIFHRKEFYAHRFRIVIKEFTGMKKFLRKVEREKCRGGDPNVANKLTQPNGANRPNRSNHSNHSNQPSAPISLSYFCCFSMKEIVLENLCTGSATPLGGEAKRGGDTLHVNYLFEHTFSTVREKDIITLFEHNQKIFKLKLLHEGSIIAEADLHILEMLSIMRNEEKKSHKIFCFIPTDADNKNILFLDVDMYYERTKMGSGDPIFDTSHRVVGPNFCVEQLAEESSHQAPHQVDLAKFNSSIVSASEKRGSNKEKLIKRTQFGGGLGWCGGKSAHPTHGEDDTTSLHRRTNCTLVDGRQGRDAFDRLDRVDGLTASPVVRPRITNGTTQVNRACSGEYVWLRDGREGGTARRGGDADEGDAQTNCAAPKAITLADGILEGHACRENPKRKHISGAQYQIRDKERNMNRCKPPTSYICLTVKGVILPAWLIRKMINRLSGKGDAGQRGDDVFVAVYVEVHQRMGPPAGGGSDGSRGSGGSGEGTYELLSRSIPQMVSDESLESAGEEGVVTNGASADGGKEEGYGGNHQGVVNPGEQTHPPREESQKESMQLLKEEETKRQEGNHWSGKQLSIHNLKINHREAIKSGGNPHVEGKITVKALISLNHLCEDVTIGEHLFKIKNILHENEDVVFCWESLFHGVYGEKALFQKEVEEEVRKMLLDSSDVQMGSTERVLMRSNPQMVRHPEEEVEKLAIVPHVEGDKRGDETVMGRKCSIEKKKKENSIVHFNSGRGGGAPRAKQLIGYVSLECEMKRTEDERNCKKRDHFEIPNFVKIYFLKKNKNNDYLVKEKNDMFGKTTLEKLFGEVLRRVSYRKYVQVDALVDALSDSIYANYVDYVIRLYRHYVGADTSLFFPVESILLILALRKLSSHFSNVMMHLFREVHQCSGGVNCLGVIEWSHFVKCMLKAQCGSSKGGGITVGRSVRSVKRERIGGAANQGKPPHQLYHKSRKREGKKTNMFASTSSWGSSFSAFTQGETEDGTSSTASSSAERHREGEAPLRGTHRVKGVNPLSQRDWCLLNHWERWHLHKNGKSCFFLLLFLNDMTIFYREKKRAGRSDQLDMLTHTCGHAQVKGKECPLHRSHHLSGPAIASGLSRRCKLPNGVVCADRGRSGERSRQRGEHQNKQLLKHPHSLKTCSRRGNHLESLDRHSHRRRATLSKHPSRDAAPGETYTRSTSAADPFARERKGKKRTSIYHYRQLRGESKVTPLSDSTDEECTNGVNSFTVLGRNLYRDRERQPHELHFVRGGNEDGVMQINRRNLTEDNSPPPYRLYVKVKRLLNAVTLVKQRMAMSFQVVLSNYGCIQSGHMLPYFESPQDGYVINKIQAISRPLLNDPHLGINTAVVLALPSRAEMNRIASAMHAEEESLPDLLKANAKGEPSYGLLKMCLQNLSLQICFYDVPFWSDSLSEESQADGEARGGSLYPQGQHWGVASKRRIQRRSKRKGKTLVASTFIPLSILLKKHKTKVRAPLVSSPFCTNRGGRSDMEVEILLKYDRVEGGGVQEKGATRRGGQNGVHKKGHINRHTSGQTHGQRKSTQVRPTQGHAMLLKSKAETCAHRHAHGKDGPPAYGIVAGGLNIHSSADTQSGLRLSDDFDLAGRHDSVDFSNIPLLTLPKIPPPVS